MTPRNIFVQACNSPLQHHARQVAEHEPDVVLRTFAGARPLAAQYQARFDEAAERLKVAGGIQVTLPGAGAG